MMGARCGGRGGNKGEHGRGAFYLSPRQGLSHPTRGKRAMKRNLVVIVVGIMFLILMTWIGTTVTEILPHQLTAQTQMVRTASYQLTLQVDPNPPPITRPTILTLQVAKSGTQQAVTDARVIFEST